MIMITMNKFRIFISDQLLQRSVCMSLSPTGIASTYSYNTCPYSLLMECALGFRLKTKTMSYIIALYGLQQFIGTAPHSTVLYDLYIIYCVYNETDKIN